MTARTPSDHSARLDATARTMRIDHVTSVVVSRLEEIGIESLVMKGPVSRALLYEGEIRDYIDSDVLVAEPNLPRARTAIREMGFTLEASPPLARHHAERWVRDKDGVKVELHWTIWAPSPRGRSLRGSAGRVSATRGGRHAGQRAGPRGQCAVRGHARRPAWPERHTDT